MDNTNIYSEILDIVDEASFTSFIFMCDLSSGVARLSTALTEYLGLESTIVDDFIQCFQGKLEPNDFSYVSKEWDNVINLKKNMFYLECRLRNVDGEYDSCIIKGRVLGKKKTFAGTIVINHMEGIFDSITELYTFSEFLNTIRNAKRMNEKFITLLIDLSHFHSVNSVYGYDFANKFLFSLSKEFKRLVNSKGKVFRLEGTKFAFFLKNVELEYVRTLYQVIKDLVRQFELDGYVLSLEIHGGAVSSKIMDVEPQTYVSYLSSALEQSKDEGKYNLVIFDENMQGESLQSLELIETVKSSIFDDCRGFYICYQPLVSTINGNVIGAEALIRWRDEKHGDVSPYRFISHLETHPSFYELGLWIIRTALVDAKRIIEEIPTFFINVNISYTQLEHREFKHNLLSILNELHFPKSQLQLELTERCRNLDINFLKKELEYFRTHGIKIALDDFGTGSAGLGLVCELPLDCLKIDQMFILNILKNKSSQVIVDTALECASRLDINVCLEGVENEEVRDFVFRYSANYHQGYYYSRPVVFEDFMKLIHKSWICNQPRLYINESRNGLNEHNILANVPGGFFIYTANEEERVLQINQTAIEMYGCKDVEEFVELTNNSFKGMVHPDDYARITREINSQIDQSSSEMDYVEYRIVKKDGTVCEVLDYGHLVHTNYNDDVFYVFIMPRYYK